MSDRTRSRQSSQFHDKVHIQLESPQLLFSGSGCKSIYTALLLPNGHLSTKYSIYSRAYAIHFSDRGIITHFGLLIWFQPKYYVYFSYLVQRWLFFVFCLFVYLPTVRELLFVKDGGIVRYYS